MYTSWYTLNWLYTIAYTICMCCTTNTSHFTPTRKTPTGASKETTEWRSPRVPATRKHKEGRRSESLPLGAGRPGSTCGCGGCGGGGSGYLDML